MNVHVQYIHVHTEIHVHNVRQCTWLYYYWDCFLGLYHTCTGMKKLNTWTSTL